MDSHIQPISGTSERLAKALAWVKADGDKQKLLKAVQDCLPELELHESATIGGWYRNGGVVTPDGEHIAYQIRDWAEEQLDGEDDLTDLIVEFGEEGYMATRFYGTTHYFIAPTGEGMLDFIQIEIDEIREVIDRPLIDAENPPEDIEELVDPMVGHHKGDETLVSEPEYALRRVSDFTTVLDDSNSPLSMDEHFKRFVEDWEASSAGQEERFSEHWVFLFQPHKDRFGEHRMLIKPRPVAEDLPDFTISQIKHGEAMAKLVHAYDRAAGFGFAWYFHMVAGHGVKSSAGEAVMEDLMGAYDYLPARDLKILRAWAEAPYAL
ncbi:MAG: hypothetical protein ACPGOV_16970 [Magnetovibrionaceae bacterium]